jgi:phosphopantothenate-cysteine ligase/phosphopantothenoylcysteine decarboxylase/phosphopantothenate--cysteine ligase
MRILVTAGNTQTPVDQVRCITNIFTGRTGARIAEAAWARGHEVTLATSHPEVVTSSGERAITVRVFRTFAELERLLADMVPTGGFDAIIHAAAVSDFDVAGVYAPTPSARFDAESVMWHGPPPQLHDVRQGKVKSHHSELWFRLTPTPKLVDCMRSAWGFTGLLVKFKLEVGVEESELVAVAEASRRQSLANLMVANTLEERHAAAWIGPVAGSYLKLPRADLPRRLLDEVERGVASVPAFTEGQPLS